MMTVHKAGRSVVWIALLSVSLAGCRDRKAAGDDAAAGAGGAPGGRGGAPGGRGGAPGGRGGGGSGAAASTGGGGAALATGAGGGVAGASAGGASGSGNTGGDAPGSPGTGTAGAAMSDGGVAAVPPGGVDWQPWPQVDPAPADLCRVTAFHGADSATAQSQDWEYDPATRILTRRHAPTAAAAAWVGYVRLDAHGRREIACSVRSPIYCQEWIRDPLGNTKTDGLLELKDGPFDLSIIDPARAPSQPRGTQITRYSHTYEAGLLMSTQYVYPARGATQIFSRDGQGRCEAVRWQVAADENSQTLGMTEVDRWSYEGDRLVSRVITNVADPTDVRSEITYVYDADGTLSATVVDGYPDIPQPYPVTRAQHDGLADYVVRTVALPDGSRWLEALELGRDGTVSIDVRRNGVSIRAARWRWNFSPRCGALALPRHTNQDCEFERPFFILPLGWDNPYTTPIAPSTPSPSLG